MNYGLLTTAGEKLVAESLNRYNEFDKLQCLFEMTELQRKQNRKNCAVQVFSEAGNYDDFCELYEESEKKANADRQNIFKRIIDWFSKTFSTIGQKIKSIFSREDSEVEIPADTGEKVNAIEKCINNMTSGFNKLKNGDWSGAWDILKGVTLPASIVGATVGTVVTYKKVKKSEADGYTKRLDKVQTTVKKVIDTITKKMPGNKDTDEQSKCHKCFNPIKKLLAFIETVLNTLTGVISKGDKNTEDANESIAGYLEDKEATQELKDTDGTVYKINPIKKTVVRVKKDGTTVFVNPDQLPKGVRGNYHRVLKKYNKSQTTTESTETFIESLLSESFNSNLYGQDTEEIIESFISDLKYEGFVVGRDGDEVIIFA